MQAGFVMSLVPVVESFVMSLHLEASAVTMTNNQEMNDCAASTSIPGCLNY
jgi:hypothetical protein